MADQCDRARAASRTSPVPRPNQRARGRAPVPRGPRWTGAGARNSASTISAVCFARTSGLVWNDHVHIAGSRSGKPNATASRIFSNNPRFRQRAQVVVGIFGSSPQWQSRGAPDTTRASGNPLAWAAAIETVNASSRHLHGTSQACADGCPPTLRAQSPSRARSSPGKVFKTPACHSRQVDSIVRSMEVSVATRPRSRDSRRELLNPVLKHLRVVEPAERRLQRAKAPKRSRNSAHRPARRRSGASLRRCESRAACAERRSCRRH